MAFDLYAGDLFLSINHSEEHVLQLACQSPEGYPELTWLWEQFYDGPRISSERAGRIVHELIELSASSDDPALTHSVQRFLPFFSRVFQRGLEITCKSD